MIGQTVSHYRILEELGRGAMGDVYKAEDVRLQRTVALKFLSRELTRRPDANRRFLNEARSASALDHPNIGTIYEIDQSQDGRLFIAMAYYQGETLKQRIARGPLPVAEAVDIGGQIARALSLAHSHGIVHRDIKPANIMLTPENVVKTLDFGLAKLKGEETQLTRPGTTVGTVAYMSPEQGRGEEVNQQTDIWALGVVLYEMLSGRRPFTGDYEQAVIYSILNEDPKPVSVVRAGVPEDLGRIVNRALEKRVEDRYRLMDVLLRDLEDLPGREVSKTLPETVVTKKGERKFRPWVVLAGALTLAGLVVLVVYLILTAILPQESKLAVLRFHQAGAEERQVYLGDMIVDALIARLQQIPGIVVAPFADVRQLEEKAEPADAARALGVDWVAHGIVVARDNAIALRWQLTSGAGRTLQQRTAEGSVERYDEVLEQVVAALLQDLELQQTLAEVPITPLRSFSPAAYEKYLNARDRHSGWDEEGSLEEAIDGYREALELDPEFGAARARLAMALLGRYDQTKDPLQLAEARREARRALNRNANLPEAHLAMGMLYTFEGSSVLAEAAFERCIELAPGNDAAFREVAELYTSLGRQDQAEAMYHRAIKSRPEYWENHYELGTFLFLYRNNLESSRQHLREASRLNPKGQAGLVVLGISHLESGDLETAKFFLEEALARGPNRSALSNLGNIYYSEGKYELALNNWRAVMAQAPDEPLYLANVGDALRQLGDLEQAVDYYEKAVEKFVRILITSPGDDENRALLAMTLAALRRCDQAREEIAGVLERNPQSHMLTYYAAVAAGRCQDQEQARELVLRLIAWKGFLKEIQSDPDFELVRRLPEVRNALLAAESPLR